jgi:hypothetical protein
MNNITKAAIGVGASVALASGIYFSTHMEEEQQLEGNRVVISKGGKYVRVVSHYLLKNQPEVTTELGKAAVLQGEELPGDAQCFVVVDAPMKKVEKGKEGQRPLPYLPTLENKYYPGTLPELIGGSEENGAYLWAIMLQGSGCLDVADHPGYTGSDMHQFINSSAKHRMLKAKRKTACPVKKDDKDKCTNMVPVNDPDADPDADIDPPIAIMGRDDLNWATAEKGKIKDRKQVLAIRTQK